MTRSVEQHALGHETDDLTPGDVGAGFARFAGDIVERNVEWRLLGIHEVHRDLGLSFHFESESLDMFESTRRLADALRDCLRQSKMFGTAEVDVVRDQERSRPDRDGACGLVDRARAEI